MTGRPSRRERLPAGYGPGVVIGPYRITHLVGQGGMGAVYAAEHTLLGRTAAIKVLLADLTERHNTVLRFFNEARAAAAIRHPGIIEIYDVGWSADGAAYIAMEYLHGESLSDRAARGAMAWPAALALARQIAGALAAAHDQGIVHRDLKPDNIFVVTDPEVPGGERIKLLDFGVAKLIDKQPSAEITHSGAILGTPTYMAPEQCRGMAVDRRADLYALGCVIFRLCAGRAPFVSASAGEVLGAHIYASPPRLGELVPEISLAAEQLVERLLAKRPEDRPACAEEVIAQIDAALREQRGADGSGGISVAASAAVAGDAEVTATRSDAPPANPGEREGPTVTGSNTGASGALAATATGLDTAAPDPALQVTSAEPAASPEPAAASPSTGPGPRRRVSRWLQAALVATALAAAGIVLTCNGAAFLVASPTASAPDRAEHAGPATAVPAVVREAPAGQAAEAEASAPAALAERVPAPSDEARPAARPIRAPAPRAPAAPPTAAMVDVAIDSIPEGAEVALGDEVLGHTPFRGKLRRGKAQVTFVIRLRGYASRQLVTRGDQPISRRVALVSQALPTSPDDAGDGDGDESVNPFARQLVMP